MKQATSKLACALVLAGALILTGCSTSNSGGGIADNGDTTSQTSCATPSGAVPCRTTTHLLHRSLVSNYFAGALNIVDATQNRVTSFAFKVGAQPTTLQPSPDGTLTLVNNTGSNTLSSFNNLEEAVKATVQLGGFTESYVTTVNNKSGFAAVPNYSNGNFSVPGAVVRFNPTDGSLNTAIPFPNVQILALDPAEKHLLAFTDADDDAHWVDLTTIDPVTQLPVVSVLALPPGTFSRPVAAFFSSDSNTAFILSCGTECGGASQASVTAIDVSNDAAAPTVKNQWPVNGARIGLLDRVANKLYVAGSMTTSFSNDCAFKDERTTGCAAPGANNVQDGWFTTIDLTALSVVDTLQIGNGVKRWIRNINGTFWVASLNCGIQSCVSMVQPTAPSSVLNNGTIFNFPGTVNLLANANGNATGIALIAIRGDSTDDVYTIEGGELFIYDQLGNPVTSEFSTDIKGQASDVLYIN